MAYLTRYAMCDCQKGKIKRVINDLGASVYRDVWIGVPQGTALGPVLFIAYDEGLTCKVCKFANDAKVNGNLQPEKKHNYSQTSIVQYTGQAPAFTRGSKSGCPKEKTASLTVLEHQTDETYEMVFNNLKCKILHLGSNKDHSNCSVTVSDLCKVNDLGVTICNSHKPGKHCAKVLRLTTH